MKTLLLILSAALTLPAQDAFRVKVTGHGQAMILIPGLSSDGSTYDSTVEHYKDRYECHVLTLAGFVGVPRIPAPMLETERDAIAAYIREKKLSKPVIVGHSLGGFLAIEIAEKYPDLVGPLVILDSYPFMSGIYDPNATAEDAKSSAEQMRKYMGAQTQDDYERYVKSGVATRMMATKESDFDKLTEWGLKTDRTAATDAMAEMFAADLRDDLGKITSRTLVLGTWIGFKQYTDEPKVEANLQREYSKLKGVEIHVSDSARHFIMWDDPNWMFAHMDEFLKPGAAAGLR
ncbi:MAG TPA: alpha/beta hydrolase [Bryobacteraceae bacterium]|nr:alpha/beta hydrolase [Bryobacteraceae bacterium]